jgi:hypothetical protein
MANVKISELNPLLTVQDADVLPIVDNAVTKKVTAAILRSYTQGNSVLLTGNQTIAGIKTFTAQLASSVATGTAPFSVASTTKVTNLNADLLDGLSSAAFQGALTLTTTGSSGASTLNTNTLNVPNYTLAGLGGVPYTGATTDLNLDSHDLYTAKVWLKDVPNDAFGSMELTDGVLHFEDGDGHSMVTMEDGYLTIANASTIRALLDVSALSVNRDFAFPNASGTLALTSDLNSYVPTTRTVSTTSPLTGGGALSSNLTLSIGQSTASTNGYLSSADWTTFNGKQNTITLTTTGTSGAATLVGSTLNIPNYADTDTGITSLNGLTALTQTFAVGTSGTDFGISSATSTHTFNLPTASAANRGALSSADWTTFNNKLNLSGGTLTGALEINNNALTQDGTRPIITLKQSGTSKLLLGVSSVADDIIVGDVAGDVDFRTNSQAFNFSVNNGGSIAFKLASTGAATFSSSVSTGADAFLATSSGGVIVGGASSAISGTNKFIAIGNSGFQNNATTGTYLTIEPGAANGEVAIKADARTGSYPPIAFYTSTIKRLNIADNGVVSFEKDATINGVTVGKGAGSLTYNTVVGRSALISITTGNFNSAIGNESLKANTTGSENVAMGNGALFFNQIGNNNTAIGNNALTYNNASNNTAIGYTALLNNTASNNTAVGFEAAYSNTSGSVTALGFRALKANTTGGANNALGDYALLLNTTGSYNIGLGTEALSDNTTGSVNIGIGLAVKSNNYSNNIIIGTLAEATASNQFVIGSSGYPAGAVASEVNASTKVWNVIINGVAQKILLA